MFSPDSSTVYIAATNVIAVYNTHTLQMMQSFPFDTTFLALAISADGSVLYAVEDDGVYTMDAGTGA